MHYIIMHCTTTLGLITPILTTLVLATLVPTTHVLTILVLTIPVLTTLAVTTLVLENSLLCYTLNYHALHYHTCTYHSYTCTLVLTTPILITLVLTRLELMTLILTISNSIYFQFQCTFIALNLRILTDSKALVPSHIQSHNPLTVYLIDIDNCGSVFACVDLSANVSEGLSPADHSDSDDHCHDGFLP